MKSWELNRRVGSLAERLGAEHEEHVARIDFNSFSEAEKVLVRKIWELQEEYGENLPASVLEANKDLVFKASEILLKYVVDTLKFALLCFMGNPENKVQRWYFDLHFYNFFADLSECLQNVKKWPDKEAELFLQFLAEGGRGKVFRFPQPTSNLDKKNRTVGEKQV